jgi:transposase
LTTHELKTTDNNVGKTLTNFTATKGDLFLADRVYASKSGISHCPSNEYVVVITSLPENINAEQILGTYRYRWQIEFYFKRLKSLLELGEVSKKRAECMEAWPSR